jgi:hypothetical protein
MTFGGKDHVMALIVVRKNRLELGHQRILLD